MCFWYDADTNTIYQITKISPKNSVLKVQLSPQDIKLFNSCSKQFKKVSDKDIQLFTTVLGYIVGGPKTFGSILASLSIPKKYKVRPEEEYLYRGIKLTSSAIKKLIEGKKVKLKDKPFTSWSSKEAVALRFAMGVDDSVILRTKTVDADIFLNIQYLNSIGLSISPEFEVLLKGNGIEEFGTDDIIYADNWNLKRLLPKI